MDDKLRAAINRTLEAKDALAKAQNTVKSMEKELIMVILDAGEGDALLSINWSKITRGRSRR